jgi:NAD-dependent SIR2 family protein deacetylase
MFNGYRTFKCTKCGHKFKDQDIEFMMTAYSAPPTCPKCGSIRTLPYSFWSHTDRAVYERIWEEMEKCQKKEESDGKE